MSNMFAYCNSLQKLDTSNFNMTNVPVDLTGLKNKDKNKTINILAGLDSLCTISISRTNKFEGISLLTNGYTNTWINVGNGTEKESENSLSLDSPKLPGTLQDIVDNY